MATIRKRGKKWQAQVRRKGRQLQSKSFPLKSEAEAWARRIEAELDRENGPIETFDLRAITLRDMLQRYRTEVTPTKRAPRQENAIIDQLLREDIAELAIPDVGSAELSAFRDKRLQYQKPATVTRHLAVLQHAYNVARQDWGWPIDRNPVANIRKPKVVNRRERRVREEELTKILSTASQMATLNLREVILLAVETGLRRGELLSIAWEDTRGTLRTFRRP